MKCVILVFINILYICNVNADVVSACVLEGKVDSNLQNEDIESTFKFVVESARTSMVDSKFCEDLIGKNISIKLDTIKRQGAIKVAEQLALTVVWFDQNIVYVKEFDK